MKNPAHASLLAPLFLALATNLTAGLLPILNGSFEAETISNGGGDNIKNAAKFQPTGIFTGWGASSYTVSFGSVSDSTALFTSGLSGTNAYRPAGNAFQNTGHTFNAGVTYTLSVDVGRTAGALTATTMEFGFRNSGNTAYVGTSVVVNNQTIPEGTFQTFTLTYTALPADQGTAINLRLTDFYSGNTDLRIDNIRLSDDSVGAAATITSLSASPASSSSVIAGSPVTFTAAVTSATTPEGTVTFYDGVTSLGTSPLDGSGLATLTTGTLGAGAHSISATYNGSASFLGSMSTVLSYNVLQSIPLANPGFEGGSGYLGGSSLSATALPGWQLTGSVFGNVIDATAEFTAGLEGTRALHIGGGRLFQQTAAAFQTGRTYTLSIDVGNPLNSQTSAAYGLAFGFRNQDDTGFLAAAFPSATTVATFPAGTFRNYRVVYTATETDNGNPIKIVMQDYYSSAFYRVDNVLIGVSAPLGSTYASWTAEFGLAADSDALDTDSDGISNLLEYAQDSSPVSATSGVLPTVALAPDGANNYLTLTTVKNPDATDLTYTVQSSGDLVTWSAAETVILTNTSTTLVVRDSIPQGTGNPRRFLRLRVSR